MNGWQSAFVFLLFGFTKIGFSQCVLEGDETLSDLKGAFCSVNNLHLFGLGAESDGLVREGALAFDTNTSVYVFPKVSAHWKGYAKTYGKKYRGDELQTDLVRKTDQGFVHFGHNQSDAVRVSLGRLPLPFGLHHEILRYQLPQRNELFWDRSVNGAVVTWRVRTDLNLDLAGTNKNSSELADREFSSFAMRATQHLDLLSGAKLVASYKNTGGKSAGKMGLAALVFNNDDISSLEWIRIADNWKTSTHQQLFRFVYQVRENDKSYTFEYEDIRRDSYRTVFSVGKRLPFDVLLGGALQYERYRFKRQSNWVAILNLTYVVTLQTNFLKWD